MTPLAKLAEKAEALLAKWDVADRDWDANAAAIDARLAGVAAGSTADLLLAPPLPREEGEEELAIAPAAAEASAPAPAAPVAGPKPQSLADLARASVSRSYAREEAENLA